ncbi:hypothetical protein LCGC14_2734070, partial [marine sediment metagenome]
RAASEALAHGGKPCRIETLLANEPEDWPERFTELHGEEMSWDDYTTQVCEAFADPDIGPAVITRLLKEDGFAISESSVARHNREQCICPVS